jgi:hypothetical protein
MYSAALDILHLGHPGITGMSAKARHLLYWPGWSKDVALHVKQCVPCAEQPASNPKPPYFLDTPPTFPGDHIVADHFQFRTESYLVMVDVFLGFPFLHKCPPPTAAPLIQQ